MRAVLLLAASAVAWAQIGGPRLGMTPDGSRLRPIFGIAGAAMAGDPIAVGPDLGSIAISPRQDYALATAADTGDVLVIVPGNAAIKVDGVAPSPDRIVISPTGAFAALWYAATWHFQIVSGLPGAFAARDVDASFLGSPKTFAVSDDGWLAGAWDAGVYAFTPDGAANPLPVDDGTGALAFFAHRNDLVLATPMRLYSLTGILGNTTAATLFDSSNHPTDAAGLSISPDNGRVVLADRDGTIYAIDLVGQALAIVGCDCSPEGVSAIGDSLFRLTSAPLRLFDARTNSTLFVPGVAAADPLSITTASFSIFSGVAFSGKLAASGGTPPYSWSIQSGSLPTGLTLDGASGTITGTPTGDVFAPPIITVTDAAGQRTSKAIPFLSFQQSLPSLTINVPATAGFAQQVSMTISMASPASTDVAGTVTLSFQSPVGGDDQMIQFGTTGRSVNFTIPAGSTQASFSGKGSVPISTGTLAGKIQLTATVTSPADLAPPPASATITTSPAAPVIDSVTLSQTSGGLTVIVTGYTPTRNMSSGVFSFTAGGSATLAQSNITVPLSGAFATWFGNADSNAFGTEFTLTVPFTVQGNASNVVRVGVDLTNSAGISNVASSK